MIRTIAFAIKFWLIMIFSLSFQIPYHFLRLFGPPGSEHRWFHWISHPWGKALLWGSGAQVELVGLENLPQTNNMCFVSNHQGYADIGIIIGYIPRDMVFLAKSELAKVPILGLQMKTLGCIFIERGNTRQGLEAIGQSIKKIEEGTPVVLFPEGTRSRSRQMARFMPGSLKMATRSKAVIVPLTIDGAYKLLEETGRINPHKVRLTIHPPIDVKELSPEEFNKLPDTLWNIINSALEQEKA